MKHSKRYIKKQSKRPLIDKRALQYIIRDSHLVQHAIKELKLAGYGKGKSGLNDWMYKQVVESIAVFASHGNSGSSALFEINLVQKLCNWDVISPLRFTDDEWIQISKDGTCQNIRKSDVFKKPDDTIHYNGAFTNRPTSRFSFATKKWTKNEKSICWSGGLFEHKNNILTGRYFRRCRLWSTDVYHGWTPKERIDIDCVEVEIAPDMWLIAADKDNTNLLLLGCYYNIEWEECPCMKGIRLEDVTPELEEKAYKEMYRNSNN